MGPVENYLGINIKRDRFIDYQIAILSVISTVHHWKRHRKYMVDSFFLNLYRAAEAERFLRYNVYYTILNGALNNF